MLKKSRNLGEVAVVTGKKIQRRSSEHRFIVDFFLEFGASNQTGRKNPVQESFFQGQLDLFKFLPVFLARSSKEFLEKVAISTSADS